MFNPIPSKFTRAVYFLITLLIFPNLIGASQSSAVSPDSREYVLKAGYIYNFTKFIKWPEKANLAIENRGLNFCLAGEDPFGNLLDKFRTKLKKKNRNLVLKPQVTIEEMPQCHILFVSQSEKSRVSQILQRVRGYPVLVIGDTPGFGVKGVGINFYIQGNKIRFEINREALERSGLVASSELLSLAKIVIGSEM
ncbi:MAG: hypothetical protein NPINA01_10500 [Nitrospinaceae bacterium]|nr:MAG: hypothetical protein NPINA01_10500 [Nitrospinaceae bacterium]